MSFKSSAPPLAADEFAGLMAVCGPFEDNPDIAVAVSGGADSLALVFLAAEWAAARGGRVTGLTVDHGLRPESGDEARQVGAWLAADGVDHVILEWRGARPSRNLMAAAREARYALIGDWCRKNGVLHLLLAHHMEDQAATLLQRLKRGSGMYGLAAMAPVREGWPRRLRPLLDVPRARLAAGLAARGRNWIDDPTNEDATFERNRVDRFLASDNTLGLTADRIALAAKALGRARRALETDVAAALANGVTVSPLGMAEMDIAAFSAWPKEVKLRALARLLLTIGGNADPPRLARLERLHDAILSGQAGKGRTLAGCHIHGRGGRLSIRHETRAIAAPAPVREDRVLWDNRFRIDPPASPRGRPIWVGRLTVARWRQLKALAPQAAKAPIPAALRWTLPVLWNEDTLLAAPHFGYAHLDAQGIRIAFTPRHALT